MPTRRFQIGIIGAGASLTAACSRAVRPHADVLAVMPSVHTAALSSLDLLLLVMIEPYEQSIRFFAECRDLVPQLPVILLADVMNANDAVELIKCGVNDLLLLPLDERALWRKIERSLLGVVRPAFDKPFLTVLCFPDATPASNRRRCFRVPVLPSLPATVLFPSPMGEIGLTLENLSLPTDRGSGGMELSVEISRVSASALNLWKPGHVSNSQLLLPSTEERIPLRLKIVRIERQACGASGCLLRLAVEYLLDNATREARVQRFWIEAQRRRTLSTAR